MGKKILIGILVLIILLVANVPNKEKVRVTSSSVIETIALVETVDNSEIRSNGLSCIGFQNVSVKILDKPYQNLRLGAINQLNGQVDYDQVYKVGDKIIIGLQLKDGMILQARTIELYRQGWLGWMFLVFIISVLIYAGFIGIKALVSFVASLAIIWSVLIKGLLNGVEPLLITSVTVVLLSSLIIFLVTGFTKRGLSAFLGTLIGLLVTMLLTVFFGFRMGLMGLTQPYVQNLFISGYHHLDYREIFYAAIILGASGAAMDIAVDISAAIHEIKIHNPEIETKALMQSGFNVGKQVIGTMATTLLLAYSGSYLTLLMLFLSKDTSLVRMLNLKIVSGEIMRTIIGSIGLVLVAPATALISSVLENDVFATRKKQEEKKLIEV